MRTCKIDGCNKKHKALGLCLKHYGKQRYQDNKEERTKYDKQRYIDNKEQIDKRMKQWRKENKEYIIKLRKKYRQTPAGKASKKASDHDRRILKKGLTKDTVQRVYDDNVKKYGVLTCCLCFKPIVEGDKKLKDSLEHLTPLTRDGSNNYDNLGVAHFNCNNQKHTMTLGEWFNNV